MLGNTLSTYFGTDPTPTVTNRITTPPPPESDNDFIDRHGRAVLARLHGTTGINVLKNEELSVSLARSTGQSDELFVTALVGLLKAAA